SGCRNQSTRRSSLRSTEQLSQLPSSKAAACAQAIRFSSVTVTAWLVTPVGGKSSEVVIKLLQVPIFQHWSEASEPTSITSCPQCLYGIWIGESRCEYVWMYEVSPLGNIRVDVEVLVRATTRCPPFPSTIALIEWTPLQLSITCTSGNRISASQLCVFTR